MSGGKASQPEMAASSGTITRASAKYSSNYGNRPLQSCCGTLFVSWAGMGGVTTQETSW
jgi:hypothetical protein